MADGVSAMDAFKNKAVAIAIEYLTSLGAHLTGHAILDTSGKSKLDEVLKKVEGLLAEGKKDEALETLKASWGGFTLADEEIFAEDLLAIARLGRISAAEHAAFTAFLAGLPLHTRKRVRQAHAVQQDISKRRMKLVDAAKLRTNQQRMAWLKASGLLDESEVEKVLGGLKKFDESFVRHNRRLDQTSSRLIRDIRTNAGRRGRFDFLMPWRWKFLNPIR